MKLTQWLVAVSVGALLSSGAQAAFLTGTFSGVAFDSERVQGIEMFGDFDGERVNGAFGFDSNGASAWLKFDVPGVVTYDFTGETGVQFTSGASDSILLSANPDQMIPGGWFRIAGPAGSLAIGPGGIDLATFNPNSILIDYLSGQFSARRGPTASVRFDRIAFDGFSSTVSEPTTLALFGCGLLALSLLGRGKRNERRDDSFGR